MYPVNIDFGFIKFYGYEGHWALGVLVFGFFYQRYNCLKAGYTSDWFIRAYTISIITGFIFARLFHFLFWDTNSFFQNPLIFFTQGGGFAVLGGTVGTGLGGYLICKIDKKDFLTWCDSLMLPIIIGLSISRISCFLNGDAYGSPTDSIFGLVFSEDSVDWTAKWKSIHYLYTNSQNPLAIISQIFIHQVNLSDIPLPNSLSHIKQTGCFNLACLNIYYPPIAKGDYIKNLVELKLYPFPVVYPPVHPTQLYESILLFFGYIFMIKIQNKVFFKRKLFFVFWAYYAFSRFVVEIFRGDRNILFSDFTYAQVICILIIFGSIIGMIFRKSEI